MLDKCNNVLESMHAIEPELCLQVLKLVCTVKLVKHGFPTKKAKRKSQVFGFLFPNLVFIKLCSRKNKWDSH